MRHRTSFLGASVLLLSLSLTQCDSSGPGPGPTEPSGTNLVGTWRSENSITLLPGDFPGRLRITLTSISESDATGSWGLGLDYGGGVTGGSISGRAVTLAMSDFDSFTTMAFSGQVQNGQIEGTFQGIAVTLMKQ